MKRALLLIVLLILTAAPITAQDDFPFIEFDDCVFEVPPSESEGESILCGYLVTLEDRDYPDSNEVSIEFAILFAEDSASDPIIYLDGGPGNAGLSSIEEWFDSPFRDERDIIVFDQRGTGYSSPNLNCFEVESDEYDDEDAALQDCHDRLIDEGIDLSMYNSAASAADVNELLYLLADEMGYDSFNLYGISYGTRLALTVLRDDDDLIRSAILDSVYPPNVPAYETEALDNYGGLIELFASCAADFDCDAAYPDLENVLIDTIDTLNEYPASFTTEDFETGELIDAEMTGDVMVSLLISALYDSERIPQLPLFIYQASEGNFDLVADLDVEGSFRRQADEDDFEYDLGDVSDSEGLYYSVECVEEIPFNSIETAASEAESIPPSIRDALFVSVEAVYSACDIWSVEPADELENEPVVSDVPTLLLTGVFDPITPIYWAEAAAETLSHSYLYVFPDQGHSVTSTNECAIQISLDFLVEPTLEPDSSCLAMETAPVFVIE